MFSSCFLPSTVIALDSPEMADVSALHALGYAVGSFCIMLFGSSLLGIALGLISALISFRKLVLVLVLMKLDKN